MIMDTQHITHYAKKTVELAQHQVNMGGLPFSSIIVDQNGDCIGKGVNQVKQLNDCTAHAEIQAIREANKMLRSPDLSGSTLFASGEPCGLCYLAIQLAKISHVVILLDRNEVKELGYDYMWTYQSQPKTVSNCKVKNLTNNYKSAPFLQCQKGLDTIGL